MSDFNKLWAGQTVSLLGSTLTMFALPTLAVLVLHATPAQIGALFALQMLPFPVLGLFVGVLADRFSRRKMMIVADLIRFATLATIPIAAGFHALALPQLYVVGLITGCASAFFGISYQAYLPAIVPPEKLVDANQKLEFSNSGTTMAGNAVAGGLVQAFGAAVAIAVDATSYLVSVASLATIRTPEPRHDHPSLTLRQIFTELREGLEIVFQSHDLRWILAATGTTNFGGSMAGAVTLIYAYRILHLQPGYLGLVEGLASIGFVGALLSAKIRPWLGLRNTLVIALGIGGLAIAGSLLALLGLPYVVLFFSAAIQAITIPIYNVNQVSYRQSLVELRLQGRLNATMRTFVWGTVPLGSLAGGYAATAFGIPQTILIGAVFDLLGAVWLLPLRERSAPTAA